MGFDFGAGSCFGVDDGASSLDIFEFVKKIAAAMGFPKRSNIFIAGPVAACGCELHRYAIPELAGHAIGVAPMLQRGAVQGFQAPRIDRFVRILDDLSHALHEAFDVAGLGVRERVAVEQERPGLDLLVHDQRPQVFALQGPRRPDRSP